MHFITLIANMLLKEVRGLPNSFNEGQPVYDNNIKMTHLQ